VTETDYAEGKKGRFRSLRMVVRRTRSGRSAPAGAVAKLASPCLVTNLDTEIIALTGSIAPTPRSSWQYVTKSRPQRHRKGDLVLRLPENWPWSAPFIVGIKRIPFIAGIGLNLSRWTGAAADLTTR
jgi:hypothetical protein